MTSRYGPYDMGYRRATKMVTTCRNVVKRSKTSTAVEPESWAATRPREAGVPSSRASPRHGEANPAEVLTARHGRPMF